MSRRRKEPRWVKEQLDAEATAANLVRAARRIERSAELTDEERRQVRKTLAAAGRARKGIAEVDPQAAAQAAVMRNFRNRAATKSWDESR